jgi:hypothetical protein
MRQDLLAVRNALTVQGDPFETAALAIAQALQPEAIRGRATDFVPSRRT